MAQERLTMKKIKEILRLKHEAGLSNRAIAGACKISNSTVGEYLRRAEAAGVPVTILSETPAPAGYTVQGDQAALPGDPLVTVRYLSIAGVVLIGIIGFFARLCQFPLSIPLSIKSRVERKHNA